MLAKLQKLGVMPSLSRPSVSNDNPYSESLFRTLKYRPGHPEKRFTGLPDARSWFDRFVTWYNVEHQHSGIKFVTPVMCHQQTDIDVLVKRIDVYETAKSKHPERWSRATRDWSHITSMVLNPTNETKASKQKAA